jgi:hypothetical protein
MTTHPSTLHTFQITASATGARHAMTTTAADTTGASLCGTVTAMPLAPWLPPVDVTDLAWALNDQHLEGLRVCKTCRTRVNVLALAL